MMSVCMLFMGVRYLQRWKKIVRDILHRTEWDKTYGKLSIEINDTFNEVGCGDECRAELAILFQKRYPDQYEELQFEYLSINTRYMYLFFMLIFF